MKTLTNRVAVITGAGGGVGRALACKLASEGCALALLDINEEALQGTVTALPSGARASTHVVDITSADQVSAARDAVVAEHGGVHIVINNAGITIQKTFATHSQPDWQRMININLWGVINGCQAFLNDLKATDEAHIVNLSSMSAFVGLPTQSSYCATKSAVQGLSESLWAELRADNIGVTSVHPGAIKTEMIQATLKDSEDIEAAQRNYEMAQKMGVTPEHVAERITTAIKKNQMRIRIGKETLLLDYLKRLFPVSMHKLVAKAAL